MDYRVVARSLGAVLLVTAHRRADGYTLPWRPRYQLPSPSEVEAMSEDNRMLPSADAAYEAVLRDLRSIIVAGRRRAAEAINTEMVSTYWRMGERIVQGEQAGKERAGYGERLLAHLGRALSHEFGRGYTERSLQNIRQFYLTYPIPSAVRTELAWTHYRTLMRLPEAQRDFYGHMAVSGRWSSRELERQIGSMLYERTGLSRKPETLVASLPQPGRPPSSADEFFRDPYILDFLGLEDTFSEKDLEAALVRNIEQFLLALGADFCFVGRQRRLTIGGEDYYVDLVFYHRRLKALVLVDLKIGTLSHAGVSQMKLYLNWTRRYDRQEGENEPVGLILCGAKNEQVIELLLADPADRIDERLRVAQYLLLDQQEALKARLAHIRAAYDQAHGTDPMEGPE
jgi:predicted nuclease of restriction endonuclease-like (RecB) superfamily